MDTTTMTSRIYRLITVSRSMKICLQLYFNLATAMTLGVFLITRIPLKVTLLKLWKS